MEDRSFSHGELSLSTRDALGVLYDLIRLCSYGRKKMFHLYLSSESSIMFSGRFPGPRLIPPIFLWVTYCTSGGGGGGGGSPVPSPEVFSTMSGGGGGGGGSPVPSPELVHTIVASMLLSCSVVMPAKSKKKRRRLPHGMAADFSEMLSLSW